MPRKLIEQLRQAGRGGDTEVAHVTPGEIVIPDSVVDDNPQLMSAIVKAFKNSGHNWRRYQVGGEDDSRNPKTGMREYTDTSGGVGGDHEGHGTSGQGQGMGGQADGRGEGARSGGVSDDKYGGHFGGGAGGVGGGGGMENSPVGNVADLAADRAAEQAAMQGSVSGRGAESAAAAAAASMSGDLGGGPGDPGGDPGFGGGRPSGTPSTGHPDTMMGNIQRLASPVGRAELQGMQYGGVTPGELAGMFGGLTAMGVVEGTQSLAGLAERQGLSVSRPSGPPGSEPGDAPGTGDTGGTNSPGPPQAPMVPAGGPPAAVPAAIPAAPRLPDFLSAIGGLSPLQQRAAIATYGISSDQAGLYRGQAARDYYRDLFLRNIGTDEEPLPIEQQYLQQGLGVPTAPGRDAFLAAIRGL